MKTIIVQIDHGNGKITQRGVQIGADGTAKSFELAEALSAGDAKKASDALDAAKAAKIVSVADGDLAEPK